MLISDILREEEDDEFCTRRTMKKKTKIPIPSPRWPPLRSFLRSRSSGKVAGDDPAPPPPLPAEVEEGKIEVLKIISLFHGISSPTLLLCEIHLLRGEP